jgi:WD40 repeat protein
MQSAVFSPDGTHIVSASDDNTACIWNAATCEPEAELKGHSDYVCSAFFSPDGTHVVSASKDNTVHIWNAATGEPDAELKGHSRYVNSAIFSPDGTHVVSASGDNTVRIWNAATSEPEAELKGHSDYVQSAVFSPNGTHVVSASMDKTVCIWDISSGHSIVCADTFSLSDGSLVQHRPNGQFHMIPASTKSYPSLLLDIQDEWITHRESGQKCWIPPQYRGWTCNDVYQSTACFGYSSGEILLIQVSFAKFQCYLSC